ncbi:MAG: phytanoyl-CoA dioxygenase family protein [Acidimicrobiales bacterium]|nr:phytanoyl-CoA dioxygenase family protein [Acidimicrobiales bacterium]|tara:strand:- start:244 stop:1161 length:918 start_codon:yes stop_codon:yes gene_type:complete
MSENGKPIRSTDRVGPLPASLENPLDLIGSEDLEQFRSDGVILVRNALHSEWLLLLEIGLQRVMNNSSQEKHMFFKGEEGEFIETIRNFDVIPEIRRFAYDSPIADLIGKLVGSNNLWLYSDEFFIKEGGNSRRTPWHQDTTYWPIEGNQIASAWISLDPLPKEECLEYVAGSHTGVMHDGFSPAEVSKDPTTPHYGKDLPPLPDIEANRQAYDIRSWEISRGDVIFAHPGVLHGGGPTGPDSRRRAITIRMYGDDLRYATRPSSKPTVPLTPGLSLSLNPGDPLRSPWYPRIRPIPKHLRNEWE